MFTYTGLSPTQKWKVHLETIIFRKIYEVILLATASDRPCFNSRVKKLAITILSILFSSSGIVHRYSALMHTMQYFRFCRLRSGFSDIKKTIATLHIDTAIIKQLITR